METIWQTVPAGMTRPPPPEVRDSEGNLFSRIGSAPGRAGSAPGLSVWSY